MENAMRRRALVPRILAVAAIASVLAGVLGAQPAPPPDQEQPARGVGRISIVNGEVSVRRGDSGDWVAAALNVPVMVEDRVSTALGAKAEVQFDAANLIRIGANAEIRLAQLDNGRVNLQVAHGTVTYRVLRVSRLQVEIETPTVSVRPMHVGSYRIYVGGDGQTEITVRAGEAQIFTPRGTEPLRAGQTMLVRGNPSDPEFRIEPAIATDEWDRWNERRDRELLGSSSNQHVPQGVYGAEDLDSYGQWVDVPSYGQVWTPSVGPDWAPYQSGRWVWQDWYGWTWVSSDPWGWAPFHYGRWYYAPRYGWCWYPGGLGVQSWSPALVAFFGFGSGGFGVGFGFGNVGWVALAPFEPCYRWWGHGFYGGYQNAAYFGRNVNITNVNITNTYRNAQVANGIFSVSAVDFQQGRFGNISRVTSTQIRDAGLVRGQLPVAPTAASLRYSNHSVPQVPRSPDNLRFFSRTSAAPVQRVPFAVQQRTMQQYVSAPRVVTPNTIAPNAGGAQGRWRPLGEPQTSPANRGNGWQRFGEPRPTAQPAAQGFSSSNGLVSQRPNYSQPSSQSTYHTYEPPTRPSYSRQESIRVAPQVMRERTYQAPQPSRPNNSAPAPSRRGSSTSSPRASSPAPRSSGGGGGTSHANGSESSHTGGHH